MAKPSVATVRRPADGSFVPPGTQAAGRQNLKSPAALEPSGAPGGPEGSQEAQVGLGKPPELLETVGFFESKKNSGDGTSGLGSAGTACW